MTSILIVEDDPLQAESLALQLVGCGYLIAAIVDHGEAAVEKALALAPDVVLMDILLAGKMDGVEAAQKIRFACDIPVLYLTAYANDEFFHRAQVTEAYAYLLKPSTSREIQLAIDISLYRHKADRTARTVLEQAVKERTAELELSQRRLVKIMETISDAFISLDPDWRFLYVNGKAGKLLGREPKELIGKHIWTEFPEDVEQPLYQAYQRAMTEQLPIVQEAYYPLWSGYFESRIFPSQDCLSIFFHDITERTLSRKKLEEKNAELDRYTNLVSHDLKSPVVTIQTFLAYLKQDIVKADAARIEKDMDFMSKAADKMSQLLDELLQMSRIGRVTSVPVRVAWRDIVREALNINAGAIAQRGVVVTVDDADIILFGEHPRLVQIWQNLIDNAVKFMGEQATPKLHIGVEQGKQGAVFFVCDNGIGVDPKYHDKIFGIFERLDDKVPGSGLGLALIRRIVQRHDGDISIDSKGVGHGTCLRFTLPAALQKVN